jgi:tRNA threonylcarbamoyl adenosine modification protein (Sua5/YciO/YrdC/YwlC family)
MSEILSLDDPDALEAAVEALEAGEPVGLPTDTVYVLAVDPFAAGASDRLFTLLRRRRDRDLSVLVPSVEAAVSLTTSLPSAARRLMDRCWPGALTLVLPRDPACAADLGDDELTIGVRMTDHPAVLALCREVGPLGVATAGPSGDPFASADDVAEALGDAVPVLLDGPAAGVQSTVIDATGTEPHLIREGAVPWDVALAALKD